MSDAETTAEPELETGEESPPRPPVAPAPPPAPRQHAANGTVSNGRLTLPPVQTTLTDPRLFEIIGWAITLMKSEADFLRTPPWERDLPWLEHARFERAIVRELRLDGENMTIGEPARIVTISGALSTNFPAAHRRRFGTLIISLGSLITVASIVVEPQLAVVGVCVVAIGVLLMVRQHQLRTTLDVKSTGFSVNGGEVRPLEDLVAIRPQKGTDRVVVYCHNPRQEIVIAPRLVSAQRDFVCRTLESEIAQIRTLHTFLKRRKRYDMIDPDRPKLDLEAIKREVTGDDEDEFDSEVLESDEVAEEVGADDVVAAADVPGDDDSDGDDEETAAKEEPDGDEEPDDDETADDEESLGEEPAADEEEPAAEEEPADDDEESADDEPADDEEEPADDEEPDDDDEESADDEEPDDDDEESADDEPADDDEEPADEGDPPKDTDETESGDEQSDSVDDAWSDIDIDDDDEDRAGEEE